MQVDAVLFKTSTVRWLRQLTLCLFPPWTEMIYVSIEGSACCRHITTAGPLGLSRDQLAAILSESQQQDQSVSLQPVLESLERQGAVQWAPTFDQSVLVSSALVDRLVSNFQGSVAGDSACASDFHSLAGLQAAGSQRNNNAAGSVDVPAQTTEADGAGGGRAEGKGLIRPWLDDTGKLNQPFWSALTQRVMSVVMRNPGKAPLLV